MKPVWVGMALGALCALAGAAELRNPGLVEDTDRDGRPDGWAVYQAFGPVRLTLAGAAGLRVDLQPRGGCTLYQKTEAPAGPCSLSCRVKTAVDAEEGVYLYLQWLNAAGEIVGLSAPSATLAGTNEWTRLVCSGQPPAAATQVVARLVVGNGKGSGGQVWLQDVRLTAGLDPAAALLNGGFEADADRDGHPDAWRPFTAGGGFELLRDTGTGHRGDSSACLRAVAGHGDRSCYIQRTGPCRAEGSLRLRLWYRGSGVSTGFVRFLPAPPLKLPDNREFFDTASFALPLPQADWREFTFETKVPAGALEAGQMLLEVAIYQRGEGSLWLDDVTVEPLP